MYDDGYPMYRRRLNFNGENYFEKYRGNNLYLSTNQDIVPYNKYLLYKYQSHINNKYYQGIKAIKYNLKYINKWHDDATISISSVSKDNSNKMEKEEVKRYLKNLLFHKVRLRLAEGDTLCRHA